MGGAEGESAVLIGAAGIMKADLPGSDERLAGEGQKMYDWN